MACEHSDQTADPLPASSAESTLMFAAAIIAGSSGAVLGHPVLHQPRAPSGIAPAHCGQRSNRLDPGWGGVAAAAGSGGSSTSDHR